MPKLSGPRLPSGKYYSKRKGAKKRLKSRAGLNKVERKETTAIAKKVVNQAAESKYFQCASIAELTSDPLSTGVFQQGYAFVPTGTTQQSNRTLFVRAFVTCDDTGGPAPDNVLEYGNNGVINVDMKNMNMARANTVDVGDMFDGRYATPSYATSTFSIQRINWDYSNGDRRQASAIMRVRLIRVTPRASNVTQTESMDPNTDLFVNETGDPRGVGDNVMTGWECEFYRVNKRKYNVLQDTCFNLLPANNYSANVQELNASSMKTFTWKHDIGKKLYYKLGPGTAVPTTGVKNEIILFHMWYPSLPNQAISSQFEPPIVIGAKAVSTFKDM